MESRHDDVIPARPTSKACPALGMSGRDRSPGRGVNRNSPHGAATCPDPRIHGDEMRCGGIVKDGAGTNPLQLTSPSSGLIRSRPDFVFGTAERNVQQGSHNPARDWDNLAGRDHDTAHAAWSAPSSRQADHHPRPEEAYKFFSAPVASHCARTCAAPSLRRRSCLGIQRIGHSIGRQQIRAA